MSPTQRNAQGRGSFTAVPQSTTGAVGARRPCSAALAAAFLAGEWTRDGLRARGRETFGTTPRWLRRVVVDVLELYHRPPLDRPRELAAVIETMLTRVRVFPAVRRWHFYEPAMGRMRWPVRPLTTVAELADFVEADVPHLLWLADTRGMSPGVHYTYVWHGTRLIERPKVELKRVQRLILREILDVIPPHDAAHGFRRGRSVVTHAAAHTGREVVVSFDLEQFFPSVDGGRVYGIFRTAGYPERVAHLLAALCLNVVPAADAASRLRAPHLPQGAPTSPALASLVALGLDRRLAALAGVFDATYTRYADDLVFSGDRRLLAPALRKAVTEIVRAEGFRLNPRKTRVVTRSGRQEVCGVVVNAHPNVSRREYDRLKAILHNGAPGIDRARLRGQIAWVQAVNPRRGAKLLRLYEVGGRR